MPQNYAEAVKWYRRAAEQGYAMAQDNLGLMYAKGEGVSEDDAEAAKWYRKAAEQGDAPAQFSLGRMYFEGQGVPQDYVSAHMWFNLAVASGLKYVKESREALANQMTPDQIAEAQRMAREWMAKHQQ